MIVQKISTLRKSFFTYFNKKDFFLAFSIVFSTITTTIITSMSSYIDDKNAVIEKRKLHPINHINIDLISYDDYIKLTDIRWVRKQKRELKDKTADYDNRYIKKSFSNIEDKEENGSSFEEEDITNNNSNELSYNKDEVSNNNVLPPERKKRKKQAAKQEFFVVDQGDGSKRDPYKYRQDNKVSLTETEIKGNVVGKIGASEIRHESVFKSIVRVFHGMIGYKENRNKRIVINSNYDKYGRKIKNSGSSTANSSSKSATLKQVKDEEIEILQQQIKEKEEQIEMVKQENIIETTKMNYFIIDGDLQKMKYKNHIDDIVTSKSNNSKIIKMMSLLEYKYEQCLYKYVKKYQDIPVCMTYRIIYNKDKTIKSIKLTKWKEIEPFNDGEKIKHFKQDVRRALRGCNISNVPNLQKKYYNYWGKANVKFGRCY